MADFFSNLGSGIRFPDARIGGAGPLPTSLSGPAGINGDPDGRYNFNSNLLDGIGPYAGPDGGRMGSDRNYQQVPHRGLQPWLGASPQFHLCPGPGSLSLTLTNNVLPSLPFYRSLNSFVPGSLDHSVLLFHLQY